MSARSKMARRVISIFIIGALLLNNPSYAQVVEEVVQIQVPPDAVSITRIHNVAESAVIDGTYRPDIFQRDVTVTFNIDGRELNVDAHGGSFTIHVGGPLPSGQRVTVRVRGLGANGEALDLTAQGTVPQYAPPPEAQQAQPAGHAAVDYAVMLALIIVHCTRAVTNMGQQRGGPGGYPAGYERPANAGSPPPQQAQQAPVPEQQAAQEPPQRNPGNPNPTRITDRTIDYLARSIEGTYDDQFFREDVRIELSVNGQVWQEIRPERPDGHFQFDLNPSLPRGGLVQVAVEGKTLAEDPMRTSFVQQAIWDSREQVPTRLESVQAGQSQINGIYDPTYFLGNHEVVAHVNVNGRPFQDGRGRAGEFHVDLIENGSPYTLAMRDRVEVILERELNELREPRIQTTRVVGVVPRPAVNAPAPQITTPIDQWSQVLEGTYDTQFFQRNVSIMLFLNDSRQALATFRPQPGDNRFSFDLSQMALSANGENGRGGDTLRVVVIGAREEDPDYYPQGTVEVRVAHGRQVLFLDPMYGNESEIRGNYDANLFSGEIEANVRINGRTFVTRVQGGEFQIPLADLGGPVALSERDRVEITLAGNQIGGSGNGRRIAMVGGVVNQPQGDPRAEDQVYYAEPPPSPTSAPAAANSAAQNSPQNRRRGNSLLNIFKTKKNQKELAPAKTPPPKVVPVNTK